MKLAILIPTLTSRRHLLERLLDNLDNQPGREHVKVFKDEDAGQMTTGQKRNRLLEVSNGCDFCAFVDDDDLVSDDYIPRVLKAIESKPDVVGLEGIMTRGGHYPQRFVHSLRYTHWYDEGQFPNKVYYRNPNHLNPVRRELALAARFPYKFSGEDHDYSKALLPLLKTEVFLEKPIYYYLAE